MNMDIYCDICGKYLGTRYDGTAKYLKFYGIQPKTLKEKLEQIVLYICSKECEKMVELNPLAYGL
jgi:hypothetical protein